MQAERWTSRGAQETQTPMKLRKGMVPLILFALVFAAWAIYTVVSNDPAPMENGESVFDQP
jgi:hypothetical protein